MPFLSEQLYQHLPHQTVSSSIHKNMFPATADVQRFFLFLNVLIICIFQWAILKNTEAEGKAEGLLQTATAIREVRELCKLNKAESNGNSLILFEFVIKSV